MENQIYLDQLKKSTEFCYGSDSYTMVVVSSTKFGIRYKVTGSDRPIYYHNRKFPRIPVKVIDSSKKVNHA